MAAYAALVSLMNIVEQILDHPRFSSSLDEKLAESLGDRISFFLDFIESYNSHGGSKEEVEDLERRIVSAAHAAEDVIESHIVDQIHAGSNDTGPTCLLNFQRIIVDMDSIKEKVMKVKDESGVKDQPTNVMPAASSRPLTTGKTTMVGFDAYLTQLLEVLTGHQSNRQIIPIVGMGGIGKTTLARNTYEHLLIVQYFDVRAWVTISQEYNVEEILLKTLSCLGASSGGIELGEQLYKTLSGRRYLIILDDMWSIEAWDKIKFFFPENNNGSRIIVTTRLSNVADQFGSLKIAVDFLDEESSWSLFCQTAFGQEGCPPLLEEVGKNIIEKCKGLPLSIVVIGGILGKSAKTLECWENVAKDISSILNSGENNQCLNILSLSYSHLPACLKPCFLYLGIFLEDHEIHVSQLIKLWVAEGFIKPKKDQSLEDIAKGYINDLVDRNLILVCHLRKNGRLKTCYIHDLLRDLCLKIAKKERFLYVLRKFDTPQDIESERRIIMLGSNEKKHRLELCRSLKLVSLAQSVSFKSRLLRVLSIEAVENNLYHYPYFQRVNLRFIALKYVRSSGYCAKTFNLSSSISRLWNVQTLIMDLFDQVVVPPEIWKMPQLRHLKICGLILPNPPPSDKEDDYVVLRNLQTLKTVENFKCSEEVTKRMPNIKTLGIGFHNESLWENERGSYYSLYNVVHLNKLESLRYRFSTRPNREDLLQNLRFPSSLKKLYLHNCMLHWNDLTVVGSLPHLEVLILRFVSMEGAEWSPVEGEFLRLKFLEVHSCGDIIFWNAEKSHFPVLENLVLDLAYKLNEFPSGIGDIPTLERIYLRGCSVSAAISAVKILEAQESLGNQSLRVQVCLGDTKAREEFQKQMRIESLSVHNFQLHQYYVKDSEIY